MPKDFKTRIKLDAPAEDVYAALTNPFALELWTGSRAVMSTEAETEFELWDGDICGRNIEFVENRRIVQEWYFGDAEPKSIVTFRISERSAEKSTLEVTHTNIPDDDYEDMVAGWQESFLEPLRAFVEGE